MKGIFTCWSVDLMASFGRWDETGEPRQNFKQTVTQPQDPTGDSGGNAIHPETWVLDSNKDGMFIS